MDMDDLMNDELFKVPQIEDQINELIKNNLGNDDLLDMLNKKQQHLNRVKKLKEDRAAAKHKMSADLEACTRQFLESLLGMCDPYIKMRYLSFKQRQVKDTGPTFLQRMEKDNEVRQTVDGLIKKTVTINDVKKHALYKQ